MSDTKLLTWRASPPGRGRWAATSATERDGEALEFVIRVDAEGRFFLAGDESLFAPDSLRWFNFLSEAQQYAEMLEARARAGAVCPECGQPREGGDLYADRCCAVCMAAGQGGGA